MASNDLFSLLIITFLFSFSTLPHHSSSLSTVAISHTANLTLICALIPSNRESYINCTSFPTITQNPITSNLSNPITSNLSFSAIVGGNGFLCGLRSQSTLEDTISCWRFLDNGTVLNYDALVDLKMILDKLETLESKMEDKIQQFVDRLETDEHIDKSEKVDKEIEAGEIINEMPSQKQTNSTFEKAKIEAQEKNESVKSKRKKKLDKEGNNEKSKKTKLQNEYIRSDEKDIINLSNIADILIEPEFVSFKNMKKNKRIRESLDMGDLDALDDVDAEDKAQNKKSLRHHIAKIDQNLAKREKAIRLGGDTDIPYKDKDKSVIKSVNNQNNGDDLDNLDWNENDDKIAKDIETGDDDELYLSVRKIKKAKKEKKFEHEQLIENNKNDQIVYEEETLPNGSKRQINYEILKNKGLTPHRKKEQRNPRVKHRNKYEKAKKKIKSIKRIVVQQEGPYGGEMTGIKTKLSRSIKFND